MKMEEVKMLVNEDLTVEEVQGRFVITPIEYLDFREGAEDLQIPFNDEGITFCFVRKEDSSFDFCRAYAFPDDFFPEMEDAFEYLDAIWPYFVTDGDELVPAICDLQEAEGGYVMLCERYTDEMNTPNKYLVESKKKEAKFNIRIACRWFD